MQKCDRLFSFLIAAISLALLLSTVPAYAGGRACKPLIFSESNHVAQRKEIQRQLKAEIADAESLPNADKVLVKIALVDLNIDGRDDLIAYLDQYPYFCGTEGCRIVGYLMGKDGIMQSVVSGVIGHESICVEGNQNSGYMDIIIGPSARLVWNGRRYEMKVMHSK